MFFYPFLFFLDFVVLLFLLWFIMLLPPSVISLSLRGCPRGVMVKAMDSGIIVREFVLQSRHYVHFRVNTLEKGKSPLILPAMG